MRESWTRSGFELHLELPAGGRRSALENALRKAIRAGRLSPNSALPSSRALASDLKLSRGTVVQAYQQLAAEGYLITSPRSATRVATHHNTATRGGRAHAPISRDDQPRYDFRLGNPDVGQFPRRAWSAALTESINLASDADLRYSDPRGHSLLRGALAEYLARVRGVHTAPERVLITSGFGDGLSILFQALATDGARDVLVENPCLPFNLDIARQAGLFTHPVNVSCEGLDTAGLPEADVAIVTPAHHYPYGATLSPSRRAELVHWAGERGAIVLEDDYDGEFRYDKRPVGALQGLAPDHVVYMGSTSKSLAPGVRLGWMVVPQAQLDSILRVRPRPYHSPPVLDQLAMTRMLTTGGFDRHLRRARAHYRNRRDLLLKHVAAHCPELTPMGIAAGLQTVLRLPADAPPTQEIVEYLATHGIAVSSITPHPGTLPDVAGIPVNFAAPPQHSYREAVVVLARTLRAALDQR